LTFDLETGARVTCDVGYLCAKFSLPRPLWSRVRPDVRDRQMSDRQTDVRQKHLSLTYGGARWGECIYSVFWMKVIFSCVICFVAKQNPPQISACPCPSWSQAPLQRSRCVDAQMRFDP